MLINIDRPGRRGHRVVRALSFYTVSSRHLCGATNLCFIAGSRYQGRAAYESDSLEAIAKIAANGLWKSIVLQRTTEQSFAAAINLKTTIEREKDVQAFDVIKESGK